MIYRPIAHINSSFPSKFGIPRQSGLVPKLVATIVFEPICRSPEAVRGLDEFSHLWLIWEFSEPANHHWKPTVRPPRLGGDKRMGVFATRSPFRPNPLGLSSVELIGIDTDTDQGPVITVGGADLMDGTPILDIKPYIAADIHTDAQFGFSATHADYHLSVQIPSHLIDKVPQNLRDGLIGALAEDPRPAYHTDPERIYGMGFAGMNVTFRVADRVLHVCGIEASDPS